MPRGAGLQRSGLASGNRRIEVTRARQPLLRRQRCWPLCCARAAPPLCYRHVIRLAPNSSHMRAALLRPSHKARSHCTYRRRCCAACAPSAASSHARSCRGVRRHTTLLPTAGLTCALHRMPSPDPVRLFPSPQACQPSTATLPGRRTVQLLISAPGMLAQPVTNQRRLNDPQCRRHAAATVRRGIWTMIWTALQRLHSCGLPLRPFGIQGANDQQMIAKALSCSSRPLRR